MAYRVKRRKKQNPSSGATTALVLGGLGLAAYLAYANGWFTTTGIVAAPATGGTPTPTTGTTNPVTNPNTQIVNAPSAPPPLGTIVTNANDIAAQVTAKLPYIVPDPTVISSAPAGYVMVAATDKAAAPAGAFYLRGDIAAKMLSIDQIAAAAAANATGDSGTQTLTLNDLGSNQWAAQNPAQVLQVTGMKGLRGLGGFRGGW